MTAVTARQQENKLITKTSPVIITHFTLLRYYPNKTEQAGYIWCSDRVGSDLNSLSESVLSTMHKQVLKRQSRCNFLVQDL